MRRSVEIAARLSRRQPSVWRGPVATDDTDTALKPLTYSSAVRPRRTNQAAAVYSNSNYSLVRGALSPHGARRWFQGRVSGLRGRRCRSQEPLVPLAPPGFRGRWPALLSRWRFERPECQLGRVAADRPSDATAMLALYTLHDRRNLGRRGHRQVVGLVRFIVAIGRHSKLSATLLALPPGNSQARGRRPESPVPRHTIANGPAPDT